MPAINRLPRVREPLGRVSSRNQRERRERWPGLALAWSEDSLLSGVAGSSRSLAARFGNLLALAWRPGSLGREGVRLGERLLGLPRHQAGPAPWLRGFRPGAPLRLATRPLLAGPVACLLRGRAARPADAPLEHLSSFNSPSPSTARVAGLSPPTPASGRRCAFPSLFRRRRQGAPPSSMALRGQHALAAQSAPARVLAPSLCETVSIPCLPQRVSLTPGGAPRALCTCAQVGTPSLNAEAAP